MAIRHQVPLISQATSSLCWEACGQMMWHWKHRDQKIGDRSANYRRTAGPYARMNRGLTEAELLVYYNTLGLRQARTATSREIIRTLLANSPVVFSDVTQAAGHAMVAVHHCTVQRAYTANNPCGHQSMNFGSGAGQCTATAVVLPAPGVERNVGTFVWYWAS
jgi:hypothetical protein